tara:strand:- start:850 stop:1098 length:249 start_codon:yes stop_codon:yes gene_type:complete
MSFKINNTEAKILWRMQQAINPDKVYLLMDGEVSRQYNFMKIRELHLKGFVDRIKHNNRVSYKATPIALDLAEKVLKSSSTE